MMERPDKKVLEALASLDGSPSFEAVMEWLERSYSAQMAQCREQIDDVLVRQYQGAAQALHQITENARSARKIIASAQRHR